MTASRLRMLRARSSLWRCGHGSRVRCPAINEGCRRLFAPTAVIRDIAKSMAEEHGLEEDWFNDAAKGFIDTSRMAFQDVVVFSHLRVRRPGDEEMLALKLASAREDSMDAKDALFLMELVEPESLERVYEIIEKHIPAPRLTPMASFFAQEIFARYKAGRTD